MPTMHQVDRKTSPIVLFLCVVAAQIGVVFSSHAGEPTPAPADPAAVFAGFPEQAELVLVGDRPADLFFSAPSRAVGGALGGSGLFGATTGAWNALANQLGLSPDEAAAMLLGGSVVIVASEDDDAWAMGMLVSTQTEQLIRKRLRAAPRYRRGEHPIMAIDDGRFELATVRGFDAPDADRAEVVFGPSGEHGLFDWLLEYTSKTRSGVRLPERAHPFWGGAKPGQVLFAVRGGPMKSSAAGTIVRSGTRWRADATMRMGIDLPSSKLPAHLAEPIGADQAFAMIVPTGFTPRWNLRPGSFSLRFDWEAMSSIFVGGRVEPEAGSADGATNRLGVQMVVPMDAGEPGGPARLDAKVGRWIAAAAPIARLRDVPIGVGVSGPDFGGRFPAATRTHTLALPYGSLGEKFGRRVQIAWRYAHDPGDAGHRAMVLTTIPGGEPQNESMIRAIEQRYLSVEHIPVAATDPSPVISAGFIRPRLVAQVDDLSGWFDSLGGVERIAWRVEPAGEYLYRIRFELEAASGAGLGETAGR